MSDDAHGRGGRFGLPSLPLGDTLLLQVHADGGAGFGANYFADGLRRTTRHGEISRAIGMIRSASTSKRHQVAPP